MPTVSGSSLKSYTSTLFLHDKKPQKKPRKCDKATVILVRLPRFRQTPDSLLGFLLCQSLLQKGHDLRIMSDAEEEAEVIEEKRTAEVMTKMFRGNARILQPGDLHLEINKNISTIVGVAPSMINSALSLRETVKCKLIIATNTKLNAKIIGYLMERVDELWSIGPKLYDDHQMIIPKRSKLEHKYFELFLNSNLEFPVHTMEENLKLAKRDRKVVSVWNEGEEYVVDGVAQQVVGSRLQDFETVLNAISEVNKGTSEFRIVWFVYGLKDQNSDLFRALCRDHINPERLSRPGSLQGMFHNCSMFILPDRYEGCHNIFVTSALIKQIPCLSPHTSSTGIKSRILPDVPQDEKTWMKSIVEKFSTDFIPPVPLSCCISQCMDLDTISGKVI